MRKIMVLFTLAAAFLLAEPVNSIFNNSRKVKESKEEMQKPVKSMELYVKYGCPYCKSVLNYLKDHNIDITIKDASLKENATYLRTNGKKAQVPCLFIDGQPLYESRDIITYLINNQ